MGGAVNTTSCAVTENSASRWKEERGMWIDVCMIRARSVARDRIDCGVSGHLNN